MKSDAVAHAVTAHSRVQVAGTEAENRVRGHSLVRSTNDIAELSDMKGMFIILQLNRAIEHPQHNIWMTNQLVRARMRSSARRMTIKSSAIVCVLCCPQDKFHNTQNVLCSRTMAAECAAIIMPNGWTTDSVDIFG